jgi:hypothetical protein
MTDEQKKSLYGELAVIEKMIVGLVKGLESEEAQ